MLMQALLDAGRVEEVLALHDAIREREPTLKPDLAMYGLSIKAFTLAKRYDEAWEIWDYVRSEVGRPDGYLYSVAFGLCDRVHRLLFPLPFTREKLKCGVGKELRGGKQSLSSYGAAGTPSGHAPR